MVTKLLSSWFFGTLCAFAHPAGQGHDQHGASADPANDRNEMIIRIEGDKRVIESNGIPDHRHGDFPNRNNPHQISPQRYVFEMPINPREARQPVALGHNIFAVAINGVVFDPATAEYWNNDHRWNYEALTGPRDLGLDESQAHVQPTGAYHYHGIPHGLLREHKADRKSMKLVAWAADGFPVYAVYAHADAGDRDSKLMKMRSSYRLKSGRRPGGDEGPGGRPDGSFTADYEFVPGSGDLDECNGRRGATPEFPNGTYYYVLTEEFPHVPRLLKGEPDASFQKDPRGMGRGGHDDDGDRDRGHRPPRHDHRERGFHEDDGDRQGPPPGGEHRGKRGGFPPPHHHRDDNSDHRGAKR